MFPIRDHNPSGRLPFITLALIAVNVIVFLGYFPSMSENQLGWFFQTWGLVPGRLMAGQGYETLVTSMFLHGGWMHLIGNMLFLYIFGDNLEEEMGHFGFLLFYLASGLAAAGLQMAADFASPIPMVGASGAIAGVMGGYLLLFPRAKVDVLFIFLIFFRIFAIPAWIVLGLWLGVQVLSGVITPTDAGGVAYWAHAGGFVGGLVLTIPAWLRRGAAGYWRKTQGHPPHAETEFTAARSNIPLVPRRRQP
ncbi:MAG: rhomboid family intramembrane serine protease [Tabrizicola sp.]|uniref:rhomboid family intramembrane serine protease n=1 Tax=Tabrizicola sp. TaxID=2005166 RepID=UPI002735E1F4|nr:rhomboid family intramembrane serine protease [Tabrizicola sp.]MDP3263633.1 rhomboid family intramembrane serine protease [Tabrizicola sp.]MDP3646997.1 rhomboid family intramembrane serine protease [Paracoccaceae bacterium]MDZ4069841.1 rhomboid family intramembrane serine protease [Tabrizicola sp.]